MNNINNLITRYIIHLTLTTILNMILSSHTDNYLNKMYQTVILLGQDRVLLAQERLLP